MARSGLGKGLGALIGTPSPVPREEVVESAERVRQINLASIAPSALQPRKDFGRDALQELIDSIRQHGIIQPLIVRPAASVAAATGQFGSRFELIAGERRWRAAQEIGLSQVPVIIRSASDMEVLELSLIENLQRADLNAIEDLQNRLQEQLATHVTIHHGEKRGRLEIEYYGNDDLQRIVTALGLTQSES